MFAHKNGTMQSDNKYNDKLEEFKKEDDDDKSYTDSDKAEDDDDE